jgi:glucose-1-phosphate thymidylyltransferase
MDAVVLAAGFATRLYPLTRDRAKPLLPIGGKPAVFHVLERLFPLARHGLERIIVLSNQRFAADFRSALSGRHPVPVEVASNGAVDERGKRGAVGDMAFGASLVTRGKPFLVLAGDNLFTFELHAAFRRFRETRAPVVLLRTLQRKEETVLYNNVRTTADGRLTAFVEKPAKPFARRFALCIYVFPPDVREDLAAFMAGGNDPDKAGFFIRWLSRRRPVYTQDPGGTWFDIGSFEEIAAADRFFGSNGRRGGRKQD